MGINIKNNTRLVDAKLGEVVGEQAINKAGYVYALQYGLDGITKLQVKFPDFLKDFIQGNSQTTEYFVPKNITEIRDYAFSGFPNLNDLTILNEEAFVTINSNALSGTKIGNKEQGSKIYVVSIYLEDYQNNYGSDYNFIGYESETWYVLDTQTITQTTLTKSIIDSLDIPINFNGIVFPTYYTRFTSITLEDKTGIDEGWLKGCNNLIFELSELPNGWVYDNGKLYVSSTDYEDFIDLHSGYESYVEQGWTLTISGSGTLTSEIIESAINNLNVEEIPQEVISIVKVTNYQISDRILSNLSPLTNAETIVFNQELDFYNNGSLYGLPSTFKNMVYLNSVVNGYAFEKTQGITGFIFARITNLIVYGIYNNTGAKKIYLPNVTYIGTDQHMVNKRIFIKNLLSKVSYYNEGSYYFGADKIAIALSSYSWKNSRTFGIIDGDNLYQKIGNVTGCDMDYPKLNGIDTETNIQALTPTEDVLYLASDTGNLWQYDSANSQWTNLFSGYTPTWYSDEARTTTISPSSITNDMTIYVKLTAI